MYNLYMHCRYKQACRVYILYSNIQSLFHVVFFIQIIQQALYNLIFTYDNYRVLTSVSIIMHRYIADQTDQEVVKHFERQNQVTIKTIDVCVIYKINQAYIIYVTQTDFWPRMCTSCMWRGQDCRIFLPRCYLLSIGCSSVDFDSYFTCVHHFSGLFVSVYFSILPLMTSCFNYVVHTNLGG